MSALLESQVKVVEADPEIKVLRTQSTAKSCFLGIAERGPIGVPTEILDLSHYSRIFGGHRANVTLRTAIEGHFNEGGGACWVTRTCHYTDITDDSSYSALTAERSAANSTSSQTKGSVLSSDGPFDLEPGDTLVVSVNGGGDLTVTFAAAAGKVDSGNAGPYVLANGNVLSYKMGGESKPDITFVTADFSNIAAATALEVANAINKQIQGGRAYVNGDGGISLESSQRGTGAKVEVTGGTGNTPLDFPLGENVGSGDAANIDAVTATEAVAKINPVAGLTATLSGAKIKIETDTAGAGGSIQVKNTSSADFGFDNSVHAGANSAAAVNTLKISAKYPGGWGNDLSFAVANASNGVSTYFNLQIYQGGSLKESWYNLTMDDADSNYVETLLNDASAGSKYITATDLDSSNSSPADRPGNATYTMTGGDDGLTGLADTDFVGSQDGGTGLYSFDIVLDGTVLVVPDRSSVQAVSTAMLSYAEDHRMFAIIDPPAGLSASGAKADLVARGLSNRSEYGAYYWPRVKVLNPNKTVYGSGQLITIPPSGIISGLYGRVDSSKLGGVYVPPAGESVGKLNTVQGLETDEVKKAAARGLVFPLRINPITANAGGVIYVDGARALKGDGNFPSVSERRGVIFIERTIQDGLQGERHKNNDARLRNSIGQTVYAFLLTQFNVGAFRGTTPDTSFSVNFGSDLNPPTEIFAGRLNGEVGLATQKPAEFIVITFRQDLRDIQAELAKAGG